MLTEYLHKVLVSMAGQTHDSIVYVSIRGGCEYRIGAAFHDLWLIDSQVI